MNTETNELIFSQAALLFTALEEANVSNTAAWVKYLEDKFQDALHFCKKYLRFAKNFSDHNIWSRLLAP